MLFADSDVFILKLTHHVDEAFRSTVEVVLESGLVLHVVDASAPDPAAQMATVREVLATITDQRLAESTEPVLAPGYPEPMSFPVLRCLGAVLNEEWEHRRYVERNLDTLEQRSAP